MRSYAVVLEVDENCIHAIVPSLPGCHTQGKNEEDALLMVKDAINAWLETANELGREIPENDQVDLAEFSGQISIQKVEV